MVPLVGSGTFADPIRPKYTPATPVAPANRKGVLGFASVLADDGKHAIVEIVGATRADLNEILSDKSPDVVSFLKGRDSRTSIETSLQVYKKNFRLEDLQVVLP
jgi:hypothetical protein